MENKIRKFRDKEKITQTKLANDLNVSRSLITALENGRAVPSGTFIHRIAQYFKVKLSEIFPDFKDVV